MLDWNRVELGFERFLELLAKEERLRAEFEASRAVFFVAASAARTAQAERRHLEWFLLERPSEALAAIPALAWQEPWRAGLPEPAAELVSAFLESLPGAFELTSLVPGEGLWVRDLFTQGEHPVAEARATATLAVGDLLVGRLFPAGGGAYLLSPAVTVFRNAELLAAVRRDLEGMRRARRGVLRIQQLELEHLFHTGALSEAPRASAAEGRAQARAALLELGLERRAIDGVLARLARAAREGDSRAVSEVLNELAFETPVELTSARLILAELWDIERGALAGEAGASASTHDAHAAIEAFDQGRAQGKDLELCFRELERDLGLDEEPEGDDEQDPVAPDFPGVVGAMVEEFLWETERELGEERARAYDVLRLFGGYAAEIGLFEELGPTHLLDFSARWVLDESRLEAPEDVARLLAALAAFCRWSEERHDVPLWKNFGATLAALQRSVPRHVRLRRAATKGAGKGAFEVLALEDQHARLRARSGDEQRVAISAEQRENLAPGDLVRLAGSGERAALGAGYPAEVAAYVK
jgi:hypothetical protein